ncbi:MAG: hypothetical protein GX638_13335, partial [Crenarchaeota archaeon]|nr:hypothetical protein [Thermoproteota archaeon]
CRICAIEGKPCYELWKAVKFLASRNFILINKKPGRAFGHKYRLENPRENLCYFQTLQDKRSHFGLPIEDFLYVTKTGKGAMYETPSRTKQNPFVNLLLEQIAKDPQILDGKNLIKAVQEIPNKIRT